MTDVVTGGVEAHPFGTLADGTTVDGYTLRSPGGIAVHVITYGGIITALHAPDRAGRTRDVVLGFDTLDGYLHDSPYFGAVIGRYANRIAAGRFTLDGHTYQLDTNDGPNALHGGVRGFDKVVWRAEPQATEGGPAVSLTYRSPDGDQGYPGTLDARVTYTVTSRDELVIDYEATTDRATPVNLTQHSYFNLAGAGYADILDHRLTVHASAYTPIDATLIPTGEVALVAGTPFDFRAAHPVGARIDDPDVQLQRAGGYDHNFVLDRSGPGLTHAARVEEPESGRAMDVYTTQPGLQFYSGNFLDGTIRGKEGFVYTHRSGLCLETQHFPNSPNEPRFPATILRPGETFRSSTVYAFSTR